MDEGVQKFLSKTLAYMLRHNQKLQMHKGGFILLDDVLVLPQLKRFTEADVMDVINNSTSNIDSVTKRFESFTHGGKIFVRASYGHSISIEEATTIEERDLFQDAQVRRDQQRKGIIRLVDMCVDSVCANIKQYDSLGGICDTYIIGLLFSVLKAQKKLSNPVLKLFFSPNIDVLDLTGVLLSDSTLQKLTSSCQNITSLNLKGQFTVVTNNTLGLIAKRLTKLRYLGLGDCKYITDPAIPAFKTLTQLEVLDLSACFSLTDEGIRYLSEAVPHLKQLKLARLVKLSDHGTHYEIIIFRANTDLDSAVASLRLMTSLQLLDVAYATLITDVSLEYMRCLRAIRSLGLCGLFQITGGAVSALLGFCPDLVTLNLQHCAKVTPDEIRALMDHPRKLKLSLGLPAAAKPRHVEKKEEEMEV